MILSILIATLEERRSKCDSLIAELSRQIKQGGYTEQVEVIYHRDNRQHSIGEKRQYLLDHCKAEYCCFVDDDDWIDKDYIEEIVRALETKPDCVGFKGIILTNHRQRENWIISNKYKMWGRKDGIYLRHTNHLTPVKTEIAKLVGFKSLNHAEDYEYSMALVPHLHTD